MLQSYIPSDWNGPWLVVCSRPQGEDVANRFLSAQGAITYVPKFLRRRAHARKIDQVPTVLFPRYILLAYDGQLCAREIAATWGVSYLMRLGEDPATIPNEVVVEIRGREKNGYVEVEEALETVLGFARGDRVRITEGPMAFLLGNFERMRGPDRAQVLLGYLGRKVLTDVSIRYLEKAADPPDSLHKKSRTRSRHPRRR